MHHIWNYMLLFAHKVYLQINVAEYFSGVWCVLCIQKNGKCTELACRIYINASEFAHSQVPFVSSCLTLHQVCGDPVTDALTGLLYGITRLCLL